MENSENKWQWINLHNTQVAHVAQYQKKKQLNRKMDKRPKETFLQKDLQKITRTNQ